MSDMFFDDEIEALIDEAGREAVFERAKALGWAGSAPPKWVWRAICADLRLEKARQLQAFSDDVNKAEELATRDPGTHVLVNGTHAYVEPKRWDEILFGFRLY